MSDAYRLCCEGVYRKGLLHCCDKPAVAMRRDPDDGNPYPVCRRHVRGRHMVPLTEIPFVIAKGTA